MVYNFGMTGMFDPMNDSNYLEDFGNNAYAGFDILEYGIDESFLNIPNMENFSMGDVSFDGITDTGGSPLIAQMTNQGAEFDEIISQQENLLPSVMSQIFSIQTQMAQNPQLRGALYPMLVQLREQQNGIEGLLEARTEIMDGMSSVYESMSQNLTTASGNIKNAANTVGDLASTIGDISVGEGIDDA